LWELRSVAASVCCVRACVLVLCACSRARAARLRLVGRRLGGWAVCRICRALRSQLGYSKNACSHAHTQM